MLFWRIDDFISSSWLNLTFRKTSKNKFYCKWFFKIYINCKNYNLFFFSDIAPNLPIEMILPFHCYHCDKRFKLKPILKQHEVIHQNERLIKVMKHPFFVKSKSFRKNLDLEKVVPSMCLPFMTRNLHKSSKDKLGRPKGKRIKVFWIRWLFF